MYDSHFCYHCSSLPPTHPLALKPRINNADELRGENSSVLVNMWEKACVHFHVLTQKPMTQLPWKTKNKSFDLVVFSSLHTHVRCRVSKPEQLLLLRSHERYTFKNIFAFLLFFRSALAFNLMSQPTVFDFCAALNSTWMHYSKLVSKKFPVFEFCFGLKVIEFSSSRQTGRGARQKVSSSHKQWFGVSRT